MYRGVAVRANRSGMSWVAGEGGVAEVGARALAARRELASQIESRPPADLIPL